MNAKYLNFFTFTILLGWHYSPQAMYSFNKKNNPSKIIASSSALSLEFADFNQDVDPTYSERTKPRNQKTSLELFSCYSQKIHDENQIKKQHEENKRKQLLDCLIQYQETKDKNLIENMIIDSIKKTAKLSNMNFYSEKSSCFQAEREESIQLQDRQIKKVLHSPLSTKRDYEIVAKNLEDHIHKHFIFLQESDQLDKDINSLKSIKKIIGAFNKRNFLYRMLPISFRW